MRFIPIAGLCRSSFRGLVNGLSPADLSAYSESFEKAQELIVGLEAGRLVSDRVEPCQRAFLHREVLVEIDLCGFYALVSLP